MSLSETEICSLLFRVLENVRRVCALRLGAAGSVENNSANVRSELTAGK